MSFFLPTKRDERVASTRSPTAALENDFTERTRPSISAVTVFWMVLSLEKTVNVAPLRRKVLTLMTFV